eukprot:ANDGO_02614.mRNA.1 Dihydrosphingosine 1-phosphate phosphatase C823.11
MSSTRIALRQFMLPIIEAGSETVARLQHRYKNRVFDAVLPRTAWFGTEDAFTFVLPCVFLLGNWKLGFWLVLCLSTALYVSGAMKDYLYLPRPKSPPVHRMEVLYHFEPGFPSTHTITSCSIVFFVLMFTYDPSSTAYWVVSLCLMLVLCSVAFGRLYLGMHCPADVYAGALLALVIASVAMVTAHFGVLESLLRYNPFCEIAALSAYPGIPECPWLASYFPPFVSSVILCLFLWVYPTPPWPTPSFTDALAFFAVANAVLIASWRTNTQGHALSADLSLWFLLFIAPLRIAIMVALAIPAKSGVRKVLGRVLAWIHSHLGFEFDDFKPAVAIAQSSFHSSVSQATLSDLGGHVDSQKLTVPPIVSHTAKYVSYVAMVVVMVDMCPVVYKLIGLD